MNTEISYKFANERILKIGHYSQSYNLVFLRNSVLIINCVAHILGNYVTI